LIRVRSDRRIFSDNHLLSYKRCKRVQNNRNDYTFITMSHATATLDDLPFAKLKTSEWLRSCLNLPIVGIGLRFQLN